MQSIFTIDHFLHSILMMFGRSHLVGPNLKDYLIKYGILVSVYFFYMLPLLLVEEPSDKVLGQVGGVGEELLVEGVVDGNNVCKGLL